MKEIQKLEVFPHMDLLLAMLDKQNEIIDQVNKNTKANEIVGTKEAVVRMIETFKSIVDQEVERVVSKVAKIMVHNYCMNIIHQHRFVFEAGVDIACGAYCKVDEEFKLYYCAQEDSPIGAAFEDLKQGDQVIYEPESGMIKKLPVPPANFRGHAG